MIPLLTAFDVQHGSGILYGFALVSAVIWCLDMNISFFRGFINARTGWTTRDSVRTLVREIDRAQRGNVFIPKAYKVDRLRRFITKPHKKEQEEVLQAMSGGGGCFFISSCRVRSTL